VGRGVFLGVDHVPTASERGPSVTQYLGFLFKLCDQKSRVKSITGGIKYTEVGKVGDFLPKSPFNSGTTRDRPMITADQ